MTGNKTSNLQGAFLCSISPTDFEISVNLGVYGNRYKKSKSGNDLNEVSKLSIIRDLIAIKPGDLIFLHVIEEQKIYGVFEASTEPFYSEQPIWNSQDGESFPCRFCFEAYKSFKGLIKEGKIPNITVSSLYEIIEIERVKSLISVEFERNVERRGVRKLLLEDASKIIKYFLPIFETRKINNNINKVVDCSGIPLKNKIFKVGNIENAVKAVLLHELAWQGNFFNILFGEEKNNIKFYDFANEVFISPITRKLMDIYIYAEFNDIEKHFVVEVKTGKVELKDLLQGIRYADLLLTLGWISSRNFEREVIMVGKNFNSEVKSYVKELNNLYRNKSLKIRLIKYRPNDSGNWSSFEEDNLQ